VIRPAILITAICAGWISTLAAQGQSVTSIHVFNASGIDGANPVARLALGPDGNFYGTTSGGGSLGYGTVFVVTTNGGFATRVNFDFARGADPEAGLTLGTDGNFWGTTYEGGGFSDGTVFQMATNGTLATMATFNGLNGANPRASLVEAADGNFYGTTYGGGTLSDGTMFVMTTNGQVTPLINFNGTSGLNPAAGLTAGPNGTLLGTTLNGGSLGNGIVFLVTTNGTLIKQFNFSGLNGSAPAARVTPGPDGNYYGTTTNGGSLGYGEVFQATTNGGLATVANFTSFNGANPIGSLTLGPDGNFYGTTAAGGSFGDGTVFRVPTNGPITTLVNFNSPINGSDPQAGLTLGPDGNFYGTTAGGGIGGTGTIFRLLLAPDFITGPTNQTVAIGGTATFNSGAFGTAPFSYRWFFNNVPVAEATNATLHISPAVTNAIGNYQVVVTNLYGSITSQVATLNVLLEPDAYGVSNGGGGKITVLLASYPNSTNRVLATTNLALPVLQWQVISTNIADGSGLLPFVDTNTAGVPVKFYRLSYP
jgi:uncharacterized repeat protein (TIGR03803 family)